MRVSPFATQTPTASCSPFPSLQVRFISNAYVYLYVHVANRPCVLAGAPSDDNGHVGGTFPSRHGRVIADTGFTKLYCDFDSAGTARYVTNAAVWLLGLDYKMSKGTNLDPIAI